MALNLTTRVRCLLPGVYLVTGEQFFAPGNGRPVWSKTYFGEIVLGARPDIIREAQIAARIFARIKNR